MSESSFYTETELKDLGLKAFGKKVLISRNAKIYGASNIEIGDNVRIDDFCILSGNIKLGSHIHIGSGTYLFSGDAGIEMEDFTGISSKCIIYAFSDDYSGRTLTSPVIFDKYKNIKCKKVLIKRHSIIGAGAIILPNVILEEGTAVGATSLISKSTDPWKIYFGSPAKAIKNRKKDMLYLEEKFLKEWIEQND